MFRDISEARPAPYRRTIIGLLLLCATSLVITTWTLLDFTNEQRIVQQLSKDLPPQDLPTARMLVGELQWQFRLTSLVLVNSIATAIAIVLLWRAYQTGQTSLRNLKALATDILDSMDQAVLTVDNNDLVTSVNRRASELMELSPQCLGTPLSQLTQQVDLLTIREATNKQDGWTMIRDCAVTVGKQSRWLRVSCQPLRDRSGEKIGHVLQARDVTRQVHVENQMRRMERFMGLGALAVGLHHEIKNPLAGLSLHVQLLEEQLDGDGEMSEIKEMLGVIKAEVSRIGNVLESFRDFASMGNLQLDEVDVVDLVRSQLQSIAPRARQLGVEVVMQCPQSHLPAVSLDRSRMEQVLLNLLLNALQAMPEGGRLTVSLDRFAHGNDAGLQVSIADTGQGIPPDIAEHIFDPYFTTKGDGMGLGLAISDKIVRQHGGEIDFQTSNSGTQFHLRLPLTPPGGS